MAKFKILQFPAKCPFPEKSSLDVVFFEKNSKKFEMLFFRNFRKIGFEKFQKFRKNLLLFLKI
jgi:hypothetical protein